MIQEITIGFVLYAIGVAFIQAGADVWLVKPYIECKQNKKYGYLILLFLLLLHDLFHSIWTSMEKEYMLLGIEMACFYPLMVFLLQRCFKGSSYYNFIFLFAMEWCFQIFGTLFTFPFFMVLCGFDIEKVGLFLNEPSIKSLMLMIALYIVDALFTAKVWSIITKNRGKKFQMLCLVCCILDIAALMLAGWKTIIVAFPVLVILVATMYLTQNRSEKVMKDQYAYYQALEEVRREKAKEISEIRHDIANHLSVMEEMSKDKQGRDILQTIDRGYGVVTGVPVLDCLISEKEKQCFEKEITFQVKSGLLGEISISEFDLISLFANLLDNGIEAAEKADEKSVDLSIEKQQGCIKIVLSNSKAKEEEPVETKFATTKRDKQNHGIGTRIIKKIVSDNDGRITYEDQGSKMKVNVIIGG